MINKIKDIPDGTEVWVKMRREKNGYDKDEYIRFRVVGEDSDYAYLNDSNEVLTEEQMREMFSVSLPKRGSEIEVLEIGQTKWKSKFVSGYSIRTVDGCAYKENYWRFPPKKIKKTLAELEKELGYEEGALEITN